VRRHSLNPFQASLSYGVGLVDFRAVECTVLTTVGPTVQSRCRADSAQIRHSIFWPWLEPFFRSKSLHPLELLTSCTAAAPAAVGWSLSGRGAARTYRGTSLIRNRAPLGPYSRIMPMALLWPYGGGAVSYERGTPVPHGGAQPFHEKTPCLHITNSRVLSALNFVTPPPPNVGFPKPTYSIEWHTVQ